ncbi:MAG TPA: hypothetical protein P5132_04070 [Bacteroidales bacterium]|nr:hypothetical protein [Bacteroidales bacterium]
MKNKRLTLTTIILVAIALFSGCSNSDDDPVTEFNTDLNGEWIGHILMDSSEEERTADTSYVLNIEQDINTLTATLTIPPEFGISSQVTLTGELDSDSTFVLNGIVNEQIIDINGFIEDEKSLQLVINGVEDESQFVYVSKVTGALVTTSFGNKYKLELKLGTAGVGRSIILVHGMDDNADTWDDMLDYFDDHNIDDNFNVWVYEYKWWDHIAYNGQKMYEMIAEKTFDEINEYPIIVAHSMGGLVARYYISLDLDPRYHYRLITLGTPHLGSGLADLASIFDWANVTGVTDLAPGSSFLEDLNSANSYEKEQHSTYWLINGKVGTYFYCYAHIGDHCVMPGYKWHSPMPPANIKAGYAALEKSNDGMVPRSSARFYGDYDVHRVDDFEWVDHISLNKNEEICKWVTNFIKAHP